MKFLSYIGEAVIFLAVAWGITAYQSRGLLQSGNTLPEFSLKTLDDRIIKSSELKGKKTVIYFFAPWCSVCRLSSHNIVDLRNSKSRDDLNIIAVALSWSNIADVHQFAVEHKLNVPVLLGDGAVMGKFKIEAFPTIYIIDENGTIKNSLAGYTTEIGLKLRLLL